MFQKVENMPCNQAFASLQVTACVCIGQAWRAFVVGAQGINSDRSGPADRRGRVGGGGDGGWERRGLTITTVAGCRWPQMPDARCQVPVPRFPTRTVRLVTENE